MDIRNEHHEIDRGKIIAHIREIVRTTGSTTETVNKLIDLVDEAVVAAYEDGEESLRQQL